MYAYLPQNAHLCLPANGCAIVAPALCTCPAINMTAQAVWHWEKGKRRNSALHSSALHASQAEVVVAAKHMCAADRQQLLCSAVFIIGSLFLL